MPYWPRKFGLFAKAVGWWWIKTVGGELVGFFQIWYAIKYKAWPPTMSWIILAICVVVAAFLAWHDEHKKAQARQTEREQAVRNCFNLAAQLLKSPRKSAVDFHGFYEAEPYNLESNDEAINVCNRLTEIGHEHPFHGIDDHILENEWLDFLRWGRNHPSLHFEKGMAYISGASEWNEKVKGRPHKSFDRHTEIMASALNRLG